MDHPSHSRPEMTPEDMQKLVGRVTRIASLIFIGIGSYILLTGGDVILGGALFLIGIVDLVLLPRILEKIMIAKLKQRQNPNENE